VLSAKAQRLITLMETLIISDIKKSESHTSSFIHYFKECMYVCVSADHPLLAARRLNYEGRSSTGSAECI